MSCLAPPVRATDDFDVICDVGGYGEYQKLADRLRERGLHEALDAPVICRWRDSEPKERGSRQRCGSAGHSLRALASGWYASGMRATIDKAGRLVIPKQLRDEVGLRPGAVDVSAYGTGLRVVPVTGEESLDERDGLLVIPAAGVQIDDNLVRSFRDAGQR